MDSRRSFLREPDSADIFFPKKSTNDVLEVATGAIRKFRVAEFSITTYENLHLHSQSPTHTAASAAHQDALKYLKKALKLPDAQAWAEAHDAEIRRHDTDLLTLR